MHIALCHNAIIPPEKYGGTERIIAWLARALVKLGHKATLVAAPGSSVDGVGLIPNVEGMSLDQLVPRDVDVLHLWSTPAQPPTRPFLVTIEGNGQPGERFHPNTVFISRKHAENHGSARYVYNGLPPEDFRSEPARGDYAVFLAKASWSVKNLGGAIAVARAAGVRLEVCGSRDWPLGIQKLLPAWGGVSYRGMVGDAEKRELLSKARALLFPVRWHEPFGIAITEALASGCPVLGTPYGSLPEIVTPDVGLLGATGAQLASALRQPGRFSPDRCRARVREGFSDLDMANGYLKLYEQLLRNSQLGDKAVDKAPATRDVTGLSSKSLLPWAMS